jgi:hypothetical protein
MKYYVFENLQTAINAEACISQIAKFPRVSVNASDGAIETEILTTKWAELKQRLDGKWVFPAVPEEIEVKYPQAVRDYFNYTFPHTAEEASSEWFSVEEG